MDSSLRLPLLLKANFLARSKLNFVKDSSSSFIKSLLSQNTLLAKMNMFNRKMNRRILRPIFRLCLLLAFGWMTVPNVSTQSQNESITSLVLDFGESGYPSPMTTAPRVKSSSSSSSSSRISHRLQVVILVFIVLLFCLLAAFYV